MYSVAVEAPLSVSCFMLVKNGEETIQKALNSIYEAQCFDDILVLIDASTDDNTFPILSAYARNGFPLRFDFVEWSQPADFAAVRNRAISQIETSYAFWLDADEYISDPAALRGLLDEADGRAFKVFVESETPQGDTFTMYQPRLFPTGTGAQFECPVLERLDWSLMEHGVEIVATGIPLIRHTGYIEPSEVLEKHERNLGIMEKYLSEYPLDDEKRQHIQTQYDKTREALRI